MPAFDTTTLPLTFAETAQDTSGYDGLLGTAQGWLSDCSLAPHRVTRAVRHRAHDEIWFVRSGTGTVWRSDDRHEEVVEARAGTCLTVPAGTSFQFRSGGDEPFGFLIFQAPPWPDHGPGFDYVQGPWEASG